MDQTQGVLTWFENVERMGGQCMVKIVVRLTVSGEQLCGGLRLR